MPDFQLVADFGMMGDQEPAVRKLSAGVREGLNYQTLLGVTGSGKTFTMANIVQEVQRPTIVIAHNKTLAAQLATEFKEFFPHNAVEYFVSYYDYYQPEAYIPRSDTYIEKDSSVNEELDKLRLAATTSLLTRRDTLIVASVSCIYGLGDPSDYFEMVARVEVGEEYNRRALLRQLIDMQYERNDTDLARGRFTVRGDTLEIVPAYEEFAVRIQFFGDEVERILTLDTLTGEVLNERQDFSIYPAKHFVTSREKLDAALIDIEAEMHERVDDFRRQGKLLEAQRLEQRTRYDMEMLDETGFCAGVENYARHLSRREAGSPPWTLLDYFPDDYLMFVDESHMTLPQVRGMYNGDISRKTTLVEYGFRLPSALDNRPLHFQEFEDHINQVVYVSATPGPLEMERTNTIVEQVIRPTGLLDPTIEVKPTDGQIDDLLHEIRRRVDVQERVLVTTLTKRMAEEMADYLSEMGHTQPLPALGHRNAEPSGNPARPAPGHLRRGGRHQPAAGRVGPAGSQSRRHPGRRQGGLLAFDDLTDPDRGTRRPPCFGPRHHVRGPGYGLNATLHRRDLPPAGHTGGAQRAPRHRTSVHPQGRQGHHRGACAASPRPKPPTR